jgi:hypothetical protein
LGFKNVEYQAVASVYAWAGLARMKQGAVSNMMLMALKPHEFDLIAPS